MTNTNELMNVNALRMLSVAQVEAANSGHPGLPLGAAPMAYTLWSRFLNVNPKDPQWIDRDRFVLSAGHGSALHYSLLHLFGFDVSLEDLRNFRQLGSKTPGHPEFGHTPGVEATTGPLGQGIANAVGMAMAEAHLAAMYNQEGYKVVDHYTYALCGDGDLMEGVASEASSLAGHLKLNKLVLLYDSNDICLDGPITKTFTESVEDRYRAYGWHYIRVLDGTNLDEIASAIEAAKKITDQPTIIEIKTVIGYGSAVQGTSSAHGAPLGKAGCEITKENLNWNYEPFEIPGEVYDAYKRSNEVTGLKKYASWQELFNSYQAAYPDQAKALLDGFQGKVSVDYDALPKFAIGDKAVATRKLSEGAIQSIAKMLPNFWGGSADLSSSNNTVIKDGGDFNHASPQGRNIWFGVREFAMGAIMNGIIYHGGTKTFAATFFVFSDYVRPAVRLAALSGLPAIYVFTHDSIAVGEDGPTHEPVEQMAAFRAMPNIQVIRPADGNETSAAWKLAVESDSRPTLLILSRQNLAQITEPAAALEGVSKGAYVLSPADTAAPHGILIATGSEVDLSLKAKAILKADGYDVSVVSMPSMERFNEQAEAYKESVLPKAVTNRAAVELGSSLPWYKYIGLNGVAIAVDRFGASGNGSLVTETYGFSPQAVADAYKKAFGK